MPITPSSPSRGKRRGRPKNQSRQDGLSKPGTAMIPEGGQQSHPEQDSQSRYEHLQNARPRGPPPGSADRSSRARGRIPPVIGPVDEVGERTAASVGVSGHP